ncbi:MAG: basic amino acid ABC transporter substrate-binding protein [Candidatus Natronoplasma sp.]
MKNGKKIMSVVAISVLLLGTIALSGCTDILDGEDKIVVGTSADFPPFEYIDEDTGDITGFDIELVKAVLEDQGYENIEVVDQDFDTLIPSLERGELDVVAAALTITEARQDRVDFTDPYYQADQSILVREGEEDDVNSFEDMAGMKVGSQSGTTGQSVVEDELVDPGIIDEGDHEIYDRYDRAVSDLVDERIDAVVIDSPVAESFQADQPVEVAFTHETGEEYAFAVQEGDDDLREDMNEGIANVQDSDTWDELIAKYFAEE